MRTMKVFDGLHIIVIGDFYQLPPVMDSYIFKDDPYNYGPLATNLWTTYFWIFSLTKIMWHVVITCFVIFSTDYE